MTLRFITCILLLIVFGFNTVQAGIFVSESNGITLTGADGITLTGADGITLTGADNFLNYKANGITLTGADGITLTGADGITLTGADGVTRQADSVVVRRPNGITLPITLTDAAQIPNEWRGYVAVALQKGLLSLDGNSFVPNRALTRIELAQALIELNKITIE